MLNRLRADFYRLFHSKGVYVFPIITVLITVVNFIVDLIGNTPDPRNTTVFDLFGEILSSGLVMFVTCLVLVNFYAAEYRNGYIKNVAGNIKGRFRLPLCKMIVGAVILLINYVFLLIEEMLTLFIHGGKLTTEVSVNCRFSDRPVRTWIFWFLIALLIHLMVNAIACMIVEITHSSAAGYVIAGAISLGLIDQLVTGFLSVLQENLGILKVLEGKKLFILAPVEAVFNYMLGDLTLFVPVALTGFVLFGAVTALTLLLVRKRDVK